MNVDNPRLHFLHSPCSGVNSEGDILTFSRAALSPGAGRSCTKCRRNEESARVEVFGPRGNAVDDRVDHCRMEDFAARSTREGRNV